MNTKVLVITAFLSMILIGVSYAACPEPDIANDYSACTSKCPNLVEHTFEAADCINKCLDMWMKLQEDSAACAKAEREAEEKKQLERDNKLRGIEEAKVTTVSTVEGMIWLTNSQGLVSKLSNSELLDMRPGSVIRSEPGSTALVTIREGSRLQLGPDSQFTYVDGEPIIEGEPEKMKYTYQVTKGRVRYKSDNQNNQYEVHTSQGTVVNRETDFIVEVDIGANMTSVYLNEGMLDVNTTAEEWLVLNPGEQVNIYSSGISEIMNMSTEDWNGLVNSTETGANFTPSWKRPAETIIAMPEFLTKIISRPGESRTVFLIMMIIAALVGIAIGTAIRARLKKHKK
jgi:ferric-dicitrate binding protein FerR (iron transport regulator)